MVQHLRKFSQNAHGSVVVLVAVAFPVMMALSAAALEYGSVVNRRSQLQAAADSGSIAGVNQFKLANTDDASAIQVAVSTAKAQAAALATDAKGTQAVAEVLNNHSSVRVRLTETVHVKFAQLLGVPEIVLKVESTARLSGTTRLCLLALDGSAVGAFHLEQSARITASDCSLYSNSVSPSGIQGENRSVAVALSTCSAGGYSGSPATFMPPPATGCPALRDPLIDVVGPTPGSCVQIPASLNPKKGHGSPDDPAAGDNIVSADMTLSPGTYCGGLHITKDTQVTLSPGVYIIKDGPLVVDKKASLTGSNVGFYFTGDRGGLLFDKDSVISLTAPKSGTMAGLLFFEDRTVSAPTPLPLPPSGKGKAKAPPGGPKNLREYRIISDDARTLLGTIYLPVGRLIIDSKKPVADQSAYTVIIARQINLYDGPDLQLNARYGSTDIPVPKGVGPSSADTALAY
ncbi:MAG: Tad domain-containing protein [Methylobacterium sp.]|nr:Tad domain-containing protein [Methylobacterium sp.]